MLATDLSSLWISPVYFGLEVGLGFLKDTSQGRSVVDRNNLIGKVTAKPEPVDAVPLDRLTGDGRP